MERNDFLKKYIQENRDRFDDKDLPPELMKKVLEKANSQKKSRRRRVFIFSLSAAACVLIMINTFIGSKLGIPETITDEQPISQIQTDEKSHFESAHQNQAINPNQIPISSTNKNVDIKNEMNGLAIKAKVTPEKDKSRYNQMITDLKESRSVSEKINAILNVETISNPNKKLREVLGQIFAEDANSNVRLAAFNALAKHAHDSTTRDYLIRGMVNESDPVIQLELVRIMSRDKDSLITEKLIQMAEAPFILPEVKDQVEYALLNRGK